MDKKVEMRMQDPLERINNFLEVEKGYNDSEAKAEASRCLNCSNPRCRSGCPVNIDIPAFIKCIKENIVVAIFSDNKRYYNIFEPSVKIL